MHMLYTYTIAGTPTARGIPACPRLAAATQRPSERPLVSLGVGLRSVYFCYEVGSEAYPWPTGLAWLAYLLSVLAHPSRNPNYG